MKLYFIILFQSLTFVHCYCQENKKNLDLIVVIDDKIAVGSISSLHLTSITGGLENNIEASYYPGSLSININDYGKILSDSTRAIYLKFTYYEYKGDNQSVYNYEIEIKKPWLEDYFNILYIYNLNKRKYKEKFDPIEKGKNYTYELVSPSHSFRVIQKKRQ